MKMWWNAALCAVAVTCGVPSAALASWEQLPDKGPSARSVPAMAYDSAHKQVLVFSGSTDSGALDDTWLLAQKGWSQVQPAASAPSRIAAMAAYDEARRQVVVFGGAIGPENVLFGADTWTWDGSTWTQRQAVPMPPPRSNGSMAYDAKNGKVVLFGGVGTYGPLAIGGAVSNSDVPTDPGMFGDTWTWDGQAWTLESPAHHPSARYGGALMPSPDGRLILFGGLTRSQNLGDTWAWDGHDWTELHPATHPPARGFGQGAYDAAARTSVLFGGLRPFDDQPYLGDLWAWDGKDWHRRTDAGGPSGRSGAGVAYDASRGGVVLFGGVNSGGYLDQTWLLRNSTRAARRAARR